MTPDEVLDTFNEVVRWNLGGEVVSEVEEPIRRVQRTDGVADLYALLDMDENAWRERAAFLRGWLWLEMTDEELRPLVARSKAKVGELCDAIAPRSSVFVVEPVIGFGDRSWEAGVHRALRRGLERRGVEVGQLRPSSPLPPLLEKHWDEVWQEVAKLSRGRLPAGWVQRYPWWVEVLGACALLGGAAFMLGAIARLVSEEWSMMFLMAAMVLLVPALILGLILRRWAHPVESRLEGVDTVGDLCRILAVHWRAAELDERATSLDT